jgi:hypothetical protein
VSIRDRNGALEILRLLSAGPAMLKPAPRQGVIELANASGSLRTSAAALADLASSGSLVRNGDKVLLTEAGENAMRRSGGVDAFQRQHRDLQTIVLNDGSEPLTAEINLTESPLAQLMRRKARDGGSFLTRPEFEAGERLRADYTIACIMPRLGANWEMAAAGSRRGEAGRTADITHSALAARQRVDRAMRAVGPELSGILVDVCCFLKGLETVERERSWPMRSGKMMLKAGLGVLARHYRPPPEAATARMQHWGDKDYKPSL